MRTLERPTQAPGGPSGPRRGLGPVLGVLLGVLSLPILVLLVVSKWGVLIAVLLAALIGLGLWTMKRGFLFIEIVAFLIHFDGVGVGPIRTGRLVALAAFGVLAYKLVVERWRPPAIPTRHWLPVMLITIYATLSAVWIDSVGAWFFAMGLLGLALAFYGTSALLVDSHEKVMAYLRAFWVGGLFGSGAGVLALFLGTRSVGFGGDPNFFGLLEASMIPLTVYYRRNEPDPVKRRWYTLALLFVLAGAAGAGSRSGLIGGAIAIVGTMVTKPGLSVGRRARVGAGAIVLAGVAFLIGFVANPANLQRGFADRGAGRLDLWTSSIELIQDRPLLGHGFGQLRLKVLPSQTTSPGVQELTDTREEVSAHNTFLDILGDLGLVGLIIWVTILVVTMLGFLRPRWRQTKEISTTMVVMMLPVFSSSMFLPLINNKLSWSLIGLSAALQVPSWGTRWRGFVGSGAPELGPGTPVPSNAVGRVEASTAPAARGGSVAEGGSRPAGDVDPAHDDGWDPVELARWDVRVSRRFRYLVAAGSLAGLVLFSVVSSFIPTVWRASGEVVLIDIADSAGSNKVIVDATANQVMDTVVTSGAYAQELRRQAGLDLTVDEVRDRVTATREKFGAVMQISFHDSDRALVEQVRPHLLPSLDAVIASNRAASLDQLHDELRPVYPGEQRFYTGRLYLPVSAETTLAAEPPRRVWIALVGAVLGALVAVSYVLLQQRRPRVNNDDDLPSTIGLRVWTHVGRPGRRYAATADQYAQVETMIAEFVGREDEPQRIVVTTPRPDRAARSLAAGLAAAIAAEGRRVVLVDAQVDSPLLTWRLSSPRRAGLLQVIDGAGIEPLLRRVNRWRLPSSVRATLGDSGDRLRFLPLGRVRGGTSTVVRPEVLERFGPDVALVVLAPSLTSRAPVGAVLAWADAVVLTLVEGRTVTFDAEDAAAPIRSFVGGPSGVVMMDV